MTDNQLNHCRFATDLNVHEIQARRKWPYLQKRFLCGLFRTRLTASLINYAIAIIHSKVSLRLVVNFNL